MNITSGKTLKPQRVVIYGQEGVGKSTIAAQFPRVLFIDTEGSTEHLDVDRTTPKTWLQLGETLDELLNDSMGYQTVVIDTADWAEHMCVTDMCSRAGKEGIEDWGFGKGYTYLAEKFGLLLGVCTKIRDSGLNVVITAHAATRKFELPEENGAFDKWELKLEKKVRPLLMEWADMVLFASFKTIVVTDKDTHKTKAKGSTRVLRTEHSATWDAKNRHGLAPELPMKFESIARCFPAAQHKTAPVSRKSSQDGGTRDKDTWGAISEEGSGIDDAATFEQNARDSCRARVAYASKALGLNKLLKRLLAQRTDADPAPMEVLEQYAADIERLAQYVAAGPATAEQVRGLMEEAFIDGEDALGRAIAVCEQCAKDAAEAETQP